MSVHIISDRQCYGVRMRCGRYGKYLTNQRSSYGGHPIEYRGVDGWTIYAVDPRDADFASCKICQRLFMADGRGQ